MSLNRPFALTILSILCTVTIYAQQTGTASYYGNKFQGRRTTSGERLDNELYTAAHMTLPLGTLVKVTNLVNTKSVVVKINDRGHFKRGRVIDLTYAAAKELEMIRLGIVRVMVEILPPEDEIIIIDSLRIIQAPEIRPLQTAVTLPLPPRLPGKLP